MDKKVCLIFWMALFLFSCKKEKQTTPDEFSFVKVYNFETEQCVPDGNGNFIMLCNDRFLKMNPLGNIEWQKTRDYYYSQDTLLNYSIFPQTYQVLGSGNIALCAIAKYEESYYCCFQLANSLGEVILKNAFPINQQFPGIFKINARGIFQANGTDFYIVGDYTDNNNNSSYFILKTDNNGNLLWKKEYLFKYFSSEGRMNKIIITPDNYFLMVGTNMNYVCVAKIDLSGYKTWFNYYSQGVYMDNGTNILLCNDGNYLITGYSDISNSTVNYNYDFFIYKISASDGDSLLAKTFGTDKQDYCVSSQNTSDGGFALIGTTNRQTQPQTDSKSYMFVAKLSASGTEEWTRPVGEDYGLQGLTTISNSDHSFTLAGNKQGYGNSNVIQTIFIKTKPIEK